MEPVMQSERIVSINNREIIISQQEDDDDRVFNNWFQKRIAAIELTLAKSTFSSLYLNRFYDVKLNVFMNVPGTDRNNESFIYRNRLISGYQSKIISST